MDPHIALKTEEVKKINSKYGMMLLIKLINGKDKFGYSLHISPHGFSFSGYQIQSFLQLIGFNHSECSFLHECFTKIVPENFDLDKFSDDFTIAWDSFSAGYKNLESCGFSQSHPRATHHSTDGHRATISPKAFKQVEDEYFKYVMTFIEDPSQKGWVFHYLPKHTPVSPEMQSALEFLGLKKFDECAENNFDPCFWKFVSYEGSEGDFSSDRNTSYVHQCFDAQPTQLALGIKNMLTAEEKLENYGMKFLPTMVSRVERYQKEITQRTKQAIANDMFDVAISFAGTERKQAEELALNLVNKGYHVFYDYFFEDQLWGKDLSEFFYDVYSKKAKYCIVFVSKEYNDRVWTNHEIRSARERMIKEKGGEYILPIKVDDSVLSGVPDTIGYVSLSSKSISEIADLLEKKLKVVK